MERYIVVFRGIGGPDSNYEGIITQTDFNSREEFQSFQKQTGNQDEVLAEGITDEEAEHYIDQTPMEAYIKAAYAEATIDGKLSPGLLEMKLGQLEFILRGRENEMRRMIEELDLHI